MHTPTPKLDEFTNWLRDLLAEIVSVRQSVPLRPLTDTPEYNEGPSRHYQAGDRIQIPLDPVLNPISVYFDGKGNLTDRDGKIICPSYDPQSPAMKDAIEEAAQRLSDSIDARGLAEFEKGFVSKLGRAVNDMQPGVMASAMDGDGDCEQPKHAAEYYADGFENDQRKREREIREAFEEGHNEGLKVGKIDASRKYLARIEELSAEASTSHTLLRERQKVLDAIPECVAHGSCVPHALDWIDSAKKRHLTDEATIRNQAATIDRLQQRVRALED